MSFRLFGALLSGLLVTELVYYFSSLTYVLPVLVAVLFTLLHALIQSYVLTMLTALFYGEMSEPAPKKEKKSHSTGTAQPPAFQRKLEVIAMKLRTKKLLLVLTIVTLLLSLLAVPALAAAGDDTAPAGDTAAQTVEDEGNTIGFKALAVGLAIGLAAAGGGIGMGIVGG